MVITKNLIIYAEKKSKELGVLTNSIESGDGNIAGFVGEICALKKIGGKIANTYDYDIIDNDGVKWDVKTKRRTVAPKDNYFCSVAAFNIKQKCDNYVFVSLENFNVAYVVGWISKEDFYKTATFYKKGELDPDSSPRRKFYFTADCYNLPIEKLNKF